MADFKGTKSKLMNLIVMFGVALLTYNFILFALCGFAGHSATFWVSYVFTHVAFASLVINAGLFKAQKMYNLKDWLFGYPVVKHCSIYIILQLLASTLFIIFEKKCDWSIAVSVQLIFFAVHVFMIMSCRMARDHIMETHETAKAGVSTKNLFRIDVESVAAAAENPEVKKALTELAEKVKYSDPVNNNNPELLELERLIKVQVENAESYIAVNDNEGALKACSMADALLEKRNAKCKALK